MGIAQLVRAPDCGSGGRGFESLYPPLRVVINGLSPSGKAQGFDPCIALVRIQLAQFRLHQYDFIKVMYDGSANIWDISSVGRALDF